MSNAVLANPNASLVLLRLGSANGGIYSGDPFNHESEAWYIRPDQVFNFSAIQPWTHHFQSNLGILYILGTLARRLNGSEGKTMSSSFITLAIFVWPVKQSRLADIPQELSNYSRSIPSTCLPLMKPLASGRDDYKVSYATNG